MTYKRILLKISGEALEDKENHHSYNPKFLSTISSVVKEISDMGVEVALVVGGGNVWRGDLAPSIGIDKTTGDYMGMLATIMNSMALQASFENNGLTTRIMSALPFDNCCEPFILRKAIRHLEKKRVIILASGVGDPFFTTDTAAALRAKELKADAILMGKNGVEGVYDDDPKKNKKAKLLKEITYHDILTHNLKVMDQTAVGLLSDSDIQIRVFNMSNPYNAIRILKGEDIGSIVKKA